MSSGKKVRVLPDEDLVVVAIVQVHTIELLCLVKREMAARFLAIAPITLDREVEGGEIPEVRVGPGHEPRFDLLDLLRYRNRRRFWGKRRKRGKR